MAGGTRSYEMARRLVEWGHEVHMITTSTDLSERHKGWSKEVIDGIQVHWLSVPYSNSMSFHQRFRAFFSFAFSAAARAAALPGDLVFATSTPLTISLPAIYSARKQKIPMVFEVRDLWPKIPIALGILRNPAIKFMAKMLEITAYKNSSRIVALSDDMAIGVAATGYPKSRISVIQNSSDIQLFDPRKAVHGSFRKKFPQISPGPLVLYPGTLGRINNVGFLVDIATTMLNRNTDIRFVVVGDGVERDAVLSAAKLSGVLNHNFFLIDPLPKRELVSAFHDASIIVSLVIDVPELEANSANKFFDALAASKPVAINYRGWQKRILEENDAGIYLTRDPVLAADTLEELLKDNDQLHRLGLNAGKLARIKYSRDGLARKLERVLLAARTDS